MRLKPQDTLRGLLVVLMATLAAAVIANVEPGMVWR